MTLARRVAANAVSALLSQVVLAVLGLVTTAVLVRSLGVARFGAWSLIGALVAYLGLFDLGLGVALVRRIATAEGSRDRTDTARALGATLGATFALGVLAAALVALLAGPMAGWLRVPHGGRTEFVAALRIGGLAAALALPGVALGAVPTALQRLDAVVRLETMVSAVTMIAQVGTVMGGGGLVALAVVSLVGRAVSLAGRMVLAWRLLGPLRARLDLRYPFWRELGRFGTLKMTHQLASQLVLYLDRLLVGALVSASAVAYYTVALELAQRILAVPGNIAAAFYPAACALAADRPAFARLYLRTSRVVSLFTLPLAAGMAIFAAPLLRMWVGEAFVGPSADLLRVVALAYGAMALTAVPAGAADALNRPEIAARYGVAGVALNVLLALILIPPLGPIGAGWALAGNVALQSPWFVQRVSRDLVGVPLLRYAREVLVQPLLPTAATAVALGAALLVGGGRGAAGVAAAVVVGGVAFALAVRLLRTFDAEERRFVAGLPGGRMLQWVVGE